jgi:putative phosphoribosyl transferase
MNRAVFHDRRDAGARLAGLLEDLRGEDLLALGIPRGGVPVAAEIAARLGADLDIVVARKLGAPYQPELAMGAVTASGGLYLNERVLDEEPRVPRHVLRAAILHEVDEARHLEERLRGGMPPPRISRRTVIVVDDGLATGATMRAAVRALREQRPARLVVAVPVAPPATVADLMAEADAVIALEQPEPFLAVGLHYEDFRPTEEAEIERLLQPS